MDIPGRRTGLFIGGLLGAVFLYLAMRTLDWSALSAELANACWPDFIPALLTVLIYFVVKASRWRLPIRPLATASTRQLLPSVTADIAGNYVFPHAGEIARTVLAGKRLRVPVAALLATVVIERVFDFLSLLLIGVVILVLAGQMAPEMRVACWTVGLICAALLGVAIAFLYYQKAALRLIERLLAPASSHLRARVLRKMRAAHAGFGAIAKPRLLTPIFPLSLLQWLLILASIELGLHTAVERHWPRIAGRSRPCRHRATCLHGRARVDIGPVRTAPGGNDPASPSGEMYSRSALSSLVFAHHASECIFP